MFAKITLSSKCHENDQGALDVYKGFRRKIAMVLAHVQTKHLKESFAVSYDILETMCLNSIITTSH